jgi:hypothetical protein
VTKSSRERWVPTRSLVASLIDAQGVGLDKRVIHVRLVAHTAHAATGSELAIMRTGRIYP